MHKILKKLSDTLLPIAKKEQSRFVKRTGRGFLATFPRVINAVRFSLNLLNKVSAYNAKAGSDDRINLRFAVNMGETRADKQNNRLGTAVNMAVRVEGLKPEQLIPIDNGMAAEEMPIENRILITERVEQELRRVNGIRIRPVGLFELKGITGLHKISVLNAAKQEKRETVS